MSIRAAREKAGYTQTDLARLIHIDQSTISLWETGRTSPRASMLLKLSEMFGCSVDFLLEKEMPEQIEKA